MTKEQAKTIYELGMQTGDSIGFDNIEITQYKETVILLIEKYMTYSMEIGNAFRPEGFGQRKYYIRYNGIYTVSTSLDATSDEFLVIQKKYEEKQPAIRKAQAKLLDEACAAFPNPGEPSVIQIELDDDEKEHLDNLGE